MIDFMIIFKYLTMNKKNEISKVKNVVPASLLGRPSLNKLIIHSISDWLMILVSVFTYLYFDNIFLKILCIILTSTRIHSFGVILHDVSHMSLKYKNIRMRIIEFLTGYPTGTSVNAMKYHHSRHHQNTCLNIDPYLKKNIEGNLWLKKFYSLKACILIPFWHLRPLLGVPAFYIPSLRSYYAKIFLQDRSQSKNLKKSSEVKTCCFEDHFQLVFSVLLFYILQKTGLILFYLFSIALTGIAAGHRLIKEHQHVEVKSRDLSTVLKNTNDHNLNGLGKFFFAPRNIGYHKVHHLHPQVAWYNLPKLRKWYVEQLKNSY